MRSRPHTDIHCFRAYGVPWSSVAGLLFCLRQLGFNFIFLFRIYVLKQLVGAIKETNQLSSNVVWFIKCEFWQTSVWEFCCYPDTHWYTNLFGFVLIWPFICRCILQEYYLVLTSILSAGRLHTSVAAFLYSFCTIRLNPARLLCFVHCGRPGVIQLVATSTNR